MNIRDHIEAGHYPRDDKGRALVPIRHGGTVTIYATDCPEKDGDDAANPIVGFAQRDGCHGDLQSWQANGSFTSTESGWDLLPPPPRKSTARAWIVYPVADDGLPCWGEPKQAYDNPHQPVKDHPAPAWTVIEMTHEYDEPWPA